MDTMQQSPGRTLKVKRAATDPPAHLDAPSSAPTTFFLMQRGRKTSRDLDSAVYDPLDKTPPGSSSSIRDVPFGVQSLEDTATSAVQYPGDVLSRTNSNTSEPSAEAGADPHTLSSRKRKAGNPVHPKIFATGQRIISSEHHTYVTESPLSHRSAESPLRSRGRRNSTSSSINVSRPLTPLRTSPRPNSIVPSTPRSGSPKSFRLSDEEQSIASDTGSQAVQSSSGDEEREVSVSQGDKDGAMPRLVMPSISMPTRRPFTVKGQRMGRAKIMLVGPRGVGKTALIQSISRACEDVVHVDSVNGSASALDSQERSNRIVEVGASTRPYPAWWTDFESRRTLLRRKSMGEGVLERNLTFIDTPGLDGASSVQQVLQYVKDTQLRMGNMASMHDHELIGMLSGEGGVHIDAVLYLFDPARSTQRQRIDQEQTELLQYLCKWTNVIPLLGHADVLSSDELKLEKQQLLDTFKELEVETCTLCQIFEADENAHALEATIEPYAISSALGDDPEIIDASVLMSSTYLQPLVPSELSIFVARLLDPENLARLRHISAAKFLLWRQQHLSSQLDLQKQELLTSPGLEPSSPGVTSTGSILEEPSKVLVPHGSSSYFRSASPSASDSSALSGNGNVIATSAQALARYNDQTRTAEPYRQVRLAKWAQDLQRSLENERKRYAHMFSTISPLGSSDTSNNNGTAYSDSEKAGHAEDLNTSLIATNAAPLPSNRPPKGRLGGDLGIIDPRDPLGLLAFSQSLNRRGWLALQIGGSCGLLGVVVWWVARNWADLQQFMLDLGQQPVLPMSVPSVAAPTRGWWDTAAADWRNLVGMER